MVLLTSNDNQEFRVDKDVVDRSVMIRNMLEDIGESEDQPIPLPNVTGPVFQKVIEYCEHHRNDPLPSDFSPYDIEEPRKRSTEVSEWDKEYIDVEKDLLFDVILAANYLDIKPLLDIGVKAVANMIKGKTPEYIRELFNIVNDFTPEEVERITKENNWADG